MMINNILLLLLCSVASVSEKRNSSKLGFLIIDCCYIVTFKIDIVSLKTLQELLMLSLVTLYWRVTINVNIVNCLTLKAKNIKGAPWQEVTSRREVNIHFPYIHSSRNGPQRLSTDGDLRQEETWANTEAGTWWLTTRRTPRWTSTSTLSMSTLTSTLDRFLNVYWMTLKCWNILMKNNHTQPFDYGLSGPILEKAEPEKRKYSKSNVREWVHMWHRGST